MTEITSDDLDVARSDSMDVHTGIKRVSDATEATSASEVTEIRLDVLIDSLKSASFATKSTAIAEILAEADRSAHTRAVAPASSTVLTLAFAPAKAALVSVGLLPHGRLPNSQPRLSSQAAGADAGCISGANAEVHGPRISRGLRARVHTLWAQGGRSAFVGLVANRIVKPRAMKLSRMEMVDAGTLLEKKDVPRYELVVAKLLDCQRVVRAHPCLLPTLLLRSLSH